MNLFEETKNDLEVLGKFDKDKTVGELIKSIEQVLIDLKEKEE